MFQRSPAPASLVLDSGSLQRSSVAFPSQQPQPIHPYSSSQQCVCPPLALLGIEDGLCQLSRVSSAVAFRASIFEYVVTCVFYRRRVVFRCCQA